MYLDKHVLTDGVLGTLYALGLAARQNPLFGHVPGPVILSLVR